MTPTERLSARDHNSPATPPAEYQGLPLSELESALDLTENSDSSLFVSTAFTAAHSEIMLLPDGRILAHHVTPELADLLRGVSQGPAKPGI
ncbi:MAG TPA: hypothetical protein PLX89_12080 [Verrucomicrobiota bacterium]|nr:hypothetical protein [Verrucomicrobiota bacterium]